MSKRRECPDVGNPNFLSVEPGADKGLLLSPRHTSPYSLTLHGTNDRKAFVDFGGDRVEYSGDLPVSEAAKLFFEAVFGEVKR